MDAQRLETDDDQTRRRRLTAVAEAIEGGVRYLYRHQYPNGEFCCYMTTDRLQQNCAPDSTAFPTAIIATALLELAEHPLVATMLTRTVSFFQYQLMRGGLLNQYTLRNHLFAFHPPFADGTAWVGMLFARLAVDHPHAHTRSLLLINRRVQGGVYTWFLPRPRLTRDRVYWRTGLRLAKHPLASLRFWLTHGWMRTDIDKVVNANILYYLGLDGETAFILDYLMQAVRQEPTGPHNSWYASPISFYYALGRNYKAGIQQLELVRVSVLERLLTRQRPNGLFGESVLETAQALSALIYWRGPAPVIEQTVDSLLTHQATYGEWPRATLFYGGSGQTTGWGSEELSTGFCLEALAAYQRWVNSFGPDH